MTEWWTTSRLATSFRFRVDILRTGVRATDIFNVAGSETVSVSVELSLCTSDSDIVRSLLTGEVEPDGIELTSLTEYPPRRHRRFFRHGEFDVCEVSLASYLSSRANREQYPFTAIPVFPSKRFRHSFFYKHTDAGIDGPADLEGKDVGVQSWQTTANVWVRGIAAEHYGLDLESVTWYRRKEDDVPIDVPDRFDVREIGDDAVSDPAGMREMLFDGDLDAAMDPAGSLFHAVRESDSVELMFDDPIAEEQAYYEKTEIHPPMHVVAIRDEVLEANPWVAVNVYDAFCEARDDAIDRNSSPSTHMTMTWGHIHLSNQREVLGEDLWEYGLTEKTRRELRTFVDYAHDQGLIPRKYAVDELFVDETVDL